MTWYPDLSEYAYLPETVPPGQKILNVGWLDGEHEFPTGDVPQEFADKLAQICAKEHYASTRGWHDCDLPHDNGELEYPFTIEVDGETVPLGSAEIRVVADDGTVLAAPNLIWHYVSGHEYRPPEEFVAAVLAQRLAPAR